MTDNDEKIDVEKFNDLLNDEVDNKSKKSILEQDEKETEVKEVKIEKKNIVERVIKKQQEEQEKNKSVYYCRQCKTVNKFDAKLVEKYENWLTGKSTEMVQLKCNSCNSSRLSKTKYTTNVIKEELKKSVNTKSNNMLLITLLYFWDLFTTLSAFLIANLFKLYIHFEIELRIGLKRCISLLIIILSTSLINSFLNINNILISFIITIISIIIIKYKA